MEKANLECRTITLEAIGSERAQYVSLTEWANGEGYTVSLEGPTTTCVELTDDILHAINQIHNAFMLRYREKKDA
jgi:hypothetical protein